MAKLDPQDIRKELSVGEVAARSGLPVSTIHFYEAQGLISSRRSSGNQRRFSRATLRIVAIIKVAQKTGIALAAIREALSRLPADHAATAADWKMLSEDWKTDLDARITRLTRLRDQLASCIGCGCLSIKDCPLRNPLDELSTLGTGPRLLDPD
jgi:MerR family redox-sensitive transcriptional activator SoxR